MANKKYDWWQLFNSPITRLVKGVDYNCTTKSMAQLVRATAPAYCTRVSVKIDGESLVITNLGSVTINA